MANLIVFLLFTHFFIIVAIILLVMLQRSGNSGTLSAGTYFAPGQANKALIKGTKILIICFIANSILMLKINTANMHANSKSMSDKINNISSEVDTKSDEIPVE